MCQGRYELVDPLRQRTHPEGGGKGLKYDGGDGGGGGVAARFRAISIDHTEHMRDAATQLPFSCFYVDVHESTRNIFWRNTFTDMSRDIFPPV